MPAWEERFSRTRQRPYYYRAETGESVWERPPDFSPANDHPANETSKEETTSSLHCHHILVKHVQSRRPISHRTQLAVVRSRQEALGESRALLDQLLALDAKGGDGALLRAEFERLAGAHSDCSSYRAGGDLGSFAPGHMQPPFERAVRATPVGHVHAGVVETDSGWHVIYRDA